MRDQVLDCILINVSLLRIRIVKSKDCLTKLRLSDPLPDTDTDRLPSLCVEAVLESKTGVNILLKLVLFTSTVK